MLGVSGKPVATVTGVAVFSARQAAGALGARHSPRPLFGRAERFRQNLARKTRGEIAKSYLLFEI
jgi:hypothetical protein